MSSVAANHSSFVLSELEATRVRLLGERFQLLLQYSQELITVVDEGATVRYDSPAIEAVLGYKPSERIGGSSFHCVHPEDGQSAAELLQSVAAQLGARESKRLRMQHRDGSWRVLEVTATNLLHCAPVRGVVLHGRDITEQARLEAALHMRLPHPTSLDAPSAAR